MADLIVTPQALAESEQLPANIVARVERILDRLRRWPEVSGAKPLSGALAGRWRIRTGDYRVQFYIRPGKPAEGKQPATPDTVIVEKIGHRDGFYEER